MCLPFHSFRLIHFFGKICEGLIQRKDSKQKKIMNESVQLMRCVDGEGGGGGDRDRQIERKTDSEREK